MGKYPSRLFVLPLAQVIDEYTKTELRSLASVPLNLSRNEIEDVVEHAAEMHWSYDGNYFFLSNNCAVEGLKLLRSGTNNTQLVGLDSIMPNGLLEVLKGRGLADTSVLDDPREALRLGYRFDSFRDRYQAMFEVLKKHLPIKQEKVEDWLALKAEERRQWIDQADLRTSAALLLLEQASFPPTVGAGPGRSEATLSGRSGIEERRHGQGQRDLAADSRQQRLPQPSGGTARHRWLWIAAAK